MAFRVMSGWAKWSEGEVISGGDIAEYCGREQVSESDRAKYGLSAGAKISEDRIKELIDRGVLRGIGDDAVMQPDAPIILQPTFEERAAITGQLDMNNQEDAAMFRNRELSMHRNRRV